MVTKYGCLLSLLSQYLTSQLLNSLIILRSPTALTPQPECFFQILLEFGEQLIFFFFNQALTCF